MHDAQYRLYKSGVAKQRFNEEVDKARMAEYAKQGYNEADALKAKRQGTEPIMATSTGSLIWEIDPTDFSTAPAIGTEVKTNEPICYIQTAAGYIEPVLSNFTGRLTEVLAQGATIRKGEALAYVRPAETEEFFVEEEPARLKRVEKLEEVRHVINARRKK